MEKKDTGFQLGNMNMHAYKNMNSSWFKLNLYKVIKICMSLIILRAN